LRWWRVQERLVVRKGLQVVGHDDPLWERRNTLRGERIMTHIKDVVAEIIELARPKLFECLNLAADEVRFRLDGMEQFTEELVRELHEELFGLVVEWVSKRAEALAGTCRLCGKRTRRETKAVEVKLKRFTATVKAVRYRCRECKTSRSPIREWLGLESGMTSGGLDRALTALTSQMSFGEAVEQLEEQHGHSLDRTTAERRTYAVGKEAMEFLQERRDARKNELLDAVGERRGVEQVIVQMDGGGVPVGELERPARDETTERTPVRNLPKGRRSRTKREVRVCMAWEHGRVEAEVVDLHIAPHNRTEVSGERLHHVALEAGAGENTRIHCVCDMASWHRDQFEEQFSAYKNRSLCADFYHTLEYIAQAGPGVVPEEEERKKWLAVQAQRLKEGDREAILQALGEHHCKDGRCPKTDDGKCAVVAARRYLKKYGQYMDYPRFIREGLPIGSGAVEGRIRHLVRRRLDVPATWRERNLHPILALISIRESGQWDAFWTWLDKRDRQRFRDRLRGKGLNKFRGKLPTPTPSHHGASERVDFDAPFDPHTELGLPMMH